MSVTATRFVWELDLNGFKKKSTKRLVLLALADRANNEGVCFPSVARLCQDTCLDRKTVMSTVNNLIEDGLLVDTGERKGTTKQVRVLQIKMDEVVDNSEINPFKQYQITQKTVPNFHDNSTKFPLNSTKSGTRNLKESKIESKIESLEVEICEKDVLEETQEFEQQEKHRKFLPREVWIEQQVKLGKWVDYKNQNTSNNKEMVVSASMKKSFDDGFSNPNAVKGIPQEVLDKLPEHLRKRVVK